MSKFGRDGGEKEAEGGTSSRQGQEKRGQDKRREEKRE